MEVSAASAHLRDSRYGASKALKRHLAIARVRARAGGGGWRARQDSNLRPSA